MRLISWVYSEMFAHTPAELGIVILAGGQGQRMNGLDKGWLDYQSQPLIQGVVRQLQSQFNGPIVISANRNLKAYESFKLPVLTDERSQHQPTYGGPLMGIQQALVSDIAKRWLSWPVDTPQIPVDYVNSMTQTSAELAVAATSEQLQYAHLLINTNQLPALNSYLNSQQRSIKGFLAQQPFQTVDFSADSVEFTNLNYPHQLEDSSLAK
ncbi:NTP transferase domain-containing protein [Thiomicrospira sp.]|uniref:molybdenum cofactor guanylyltransferase n=1 Tax=Thiomicrospira sp. TaxID=935 RepID=UPI0026005949|nr:NTP transferase domain-containing protein [Thiomicrospira sp.]